MHEDGHDDTAIGPLTAPRGGERRVDHKRKKRALPRAADLLLTDTYSRIVEFLLAAGGEGSPHSPVLIRSSARSSTLALMSSDDAAAASAFHSCQISTSVSATSISSISRCHLVIATASSGAIVGRPWSSTGWTASMRTCSSTLSVLMATSFAVPYPYPYPASSSDREQRPPGGTGPRPSGSL